MMDVALFIVTASAEIVGCYLPYLWLRSGNLQSRRGERIAIRKAQPARR
jgi:drug/metabolite transporter superfamily protein YnfA